MFVRILMAVVADSKGWNRFYILMNWPWSVLSTFVYFIASSTPLFLLGKVLEAFKESSYWAVSRTSIFSLSRKQEEKDATRNIAVLLLSVAVGSAVAGFGISYFGFSFTFSILIVSSGFIAIPSALLWKIPKQNFKSDNPRFREIINLSNLLLPVFMVQQIGYDYLAVGIAYMLYNLVSSIVIFGTLRFSLGIRRVILQSSIALFATFLLTSSNYYFFGLFLALAVAEGLGWIFLESIVAKATKDKPNVSVDIGLLFIPLRFAEFGSVLYAGFIAQNIGYAPVFASSGIFFTIFSVLALYLLRN
jgi:predicted MFS family arabinose efflux permease